MTDLPAGLMMGELTRVLKEAFEGPPGPWSYFTDRYPGAGVLGTIEKLSAARASRPAGAARTTIAGHVQHLAASLALYVKWIRGELLPRDRGRGQSWTVSAVNDAAWAKLHAQLRREYEALVLTVETQRVWDEDALGGALGAIAHAAYHLGAIRQRLALEGGD